MKALLIVNNAGHQQEHAAWMREGLGRYNIDVVFGKRGDFVPCDFVIVWGLRQLATNTAAKRAGVPILVMERGHLQPRMEWTSLGWNELAGRGTYPGCLDTGERFARHFGHLMQPWSDDGDAALILGQIPGDMSLRGTDPKKWATNAAAECRAAGFGRVIYRRHPRVAQTGDAWHPPGAVLSRYAALEDDLAQSAIAVSFSSTSGVEAILSGTPHVAFDEGSMVWPVSAQRRFTRQTPDRRDWANALAWTQWQEHEIRSGAAWEAIRTCGGL